jgi:hypothetical protein
MKQGTPPVLLIGASLLVVAALCLISRTGRRVFVLLAIPAVPYTAYMIGYTSIGSAWLPAAAWPPAVQAVWVLLPALLAIFVIAALRRARAATREQVLPEGPRPTD